MHVEVMPEFEPADVSAISIERMVAELWRAMLRQPHPQLSNSAAAPRHGTARALKE